MIHSLIHSLIHCLLVVSIIRTRTGYLKHIASYYTEPPQSQAHLKLGRDPGADRVDLTGQTVVVTGGNSGIGKEVATYVAAKGATVYLLCRSAERAEAARQEIGQLCDSPNNVHVVLADLSELAQVRRVAAELNDRCSDTGIYCLVCNAGVLFNEQRNNSEGLEQTFASHLLGGTYLLTELLLPRLKQAPNSRVVVVSSGGMYNTGLPSFDVMTSYTAPGSSTAPSNFKYNGNLAYAYAKRGQIVLAEEWSKQHTDQVKFVTVHPGWTNTPAVDEAYGDQKKYLEPMREPWQGAEGVAWLVAAPASELQSGEFYLDRRVQKKHLAGPFMTEGSFTKNKPEEIQTFLEKLRQTAGLDE